MILENSVGQVLIVKAGYKPYWTFPGGIVEPSETPKQAAIRETFEEIGVRIAPEKVEFVGVVDRKSEITHTYQFIFKTTIEPGALEEIALQESEIDEYVLVTKNQVKTGDRPYGKVIKHWMNGTTGYIEQVFGGKDDS